MDLRARRARIAALPALAVLVVAVAVGAAASAGHATNGPVDQGAAIDAVSVIVTLAGLVLAGVVAWVAWIWLRTADWRRGRGSGNAARFRILHQVLVSLIPVAAIAVAIFILFLRRRRNGGGGSTGLAGRATGHLVRGHPLPYSVSAGAWTLGGVAMIALVVVAYFWLGRLRRRSRAQVLHEIEVDHPAVEMAKSLLAPLEELEIADPRSEPDPRKAVIAAWIAMTDAIGRAWRPRTASEAPREYLREALVTAGVQPGSAGRLTSLFEVARWSVQQVGEEMRDDAISALDTVRAELRAAA